MNKEGARCLQCWSPRWGGDGLAIGLGVRNDVGDGLMEGLRLAARGSRGAWSVEGVLDGSPWEMRASALDLTPVTIAASGESDFQQPVTHDRRAFADAPRREGIGPALEESAHAIPIRRSR